MTPNDRINMIIEYAKKVLQYPKGSNGYDPVDAMNLEMAIENYEKEKAKEPEYKYVWLIMPEGRFSNSWDEHTMKTLGKGVLEDSKDTQSKLIKFQCINDSQFEFFL